MNEFEHVVELAVKSASDALLQLTGSVHMETRWAEILPTLSIAGRVEHPETRSLAAYIDISGEQPGRGLLLINADDAMILVDLVLGKTPGETTDFGELELSALLEMANIVTSNYINAIADYLGCTLHPNPPAFACDMAGAILQQTICACAAVQSSTFCVATRMTYTGHDIDGLFLYFPDTTPTDITRE